MKPALEHFPGVCVLKSMELMKMHPGICIDSISLGGNVGGLLFTFASVLLIAGSLPAAREFFLASIAMGLMGAAIRIYRYR